MPRPARFAAALLCAAVLAAASPNDEAAALIAKGQFLAAERILMPLARAKKPDALSLYQFSQVRLGQHQSAEAIDLVKRAIKLDDRRPEFFSHLAAAYAQQLEDNPNAFVHDKIRKAYEQSVKLDPNHVPGLLGLSRCYSTPAPGEPPSYKKAKEAASRVAALDPFPGELELGRLELLVRQPAGALVHYQKALQLRPADAIAHYSAALALLQLGRRDEARAHLQEVIRLSPEDKDAREALRSLDEPAAPAPAR